jgi:hypothetical protein
LFEIQTKRCTGNQRTALKPEEEEAIVWLWAKPNLLPWPRPVEWLFSPITGNAEWPGDLWGVDEDGELLIIENKILKRSGDHYDPFKDFVSYKGEPKFCIAGTLFEKWSDLYHAEVNFVSRLEDRGRDKRGVLPNSVHCSCLQYWPKLTTDIEARIRNANGQYANAVMRYLSCRAIKGNPRPHYCGLFVRTQRQAEERSGDYFAGSRQKLIERGVSKPHVHLFVASAEVRDGNSVEISVTGTQDIILKIGAEGGDLTLYGDRTGGGWLFSLSVNDCSPLMLDEGEPAIKHTSSCVTSWAGAIALLDKYSWAKLYPLAVHADFRKQVWGAVESRLCNDPRDQAALDKWRRVCRK